MFKIKGCGRDILFATGDVVEFIGWTNAFPDYIRVAHAFNDKDGCSADNFGQGLNEGDPSQPPRGWIVVHKQSLVPFNALAKTILAQLPRVNQ